MGNRILIAGTSSDSGKTTITCGILGAFKKLGKNLASFKCGPDFIDPMFHNEITGVPTYNLDTYLFGDENVKNILAFHSREKDFSLIEGVMGLYDGVSNTSKGSANYISVVTGTPTILIVNPKGQSHSICALIKGFYEYEENMIKGIILNNISEKMYNFYKNIIESNLDVEVLGFMPYIKKASFSSRHLGLVRAHEIIDLKNKINLLSENTIKHINLERVFEISRQHKNLVETKMINSIKDINVKVNIYIAKDDAFCFYYEDNHLLLESLGVDIKFFSPLNNEPLPNDADGLILWGGYPELYLEKLSENTLTIESIQSNIEKQIPVYAESGGFMYLHDSITDLEGTKANMVGVINQDAKIIDKLSNFGYVELVANKDNILCEEGGSIKAHSFHYSTNEIEGDVFTATKTNGIQSYNCFVEYKNTIGSFLHIHFLSNPKFLKSFVNKCIEYKRRGENK